MFAASWYSEQTQTNIFLVRGVHPYHLVSGSWACALEACKLSPVMNGDDQLPGSEQYHSNQQDAANHREQHHQSIWPTTTL